MSVLKRQILPLTSDPLQEDPLDKDRAHSMADEGGAFPALYEEQYPPAAAAGYARGGFWTGAASTLALGLVGYGIWRASRPRESQPT